MYSQDERNITDGNNICRSKEDPKQGSKNLKSKVVSSYKREQDIDKKYADRGSAGKKQSAKEKQDLVSQTAKIFDLIESYGIDAPKARVVSKLKERKMAVKFVQ